MPFPVPETLAAAAAAESRRIIDEAIAGRPDFGPALPAELPSSWTDRIRGTHANTSTDTLVGPAVSDSAPTVENDKKKEEKKQEKEEDYGRGEVEFGPHLPPGLPSSWTGSIWASNKTDASTLAEAEGAKPTPATNKERTCYVRTLLRELEDKPQGLKQYFVAYQAGSAARKFKLRMAIEKLLRKEWMNVPLQLAMEAAGKESGVMFREEEVRGLLRDELDKPWEFFGVGDEEVEERKVLTWRGDVVVKESEVWDLRDAKEIVEQAARKVDRSVMRWIML